MLFPTGLWGADYAYFSPNGGRKWSLHSVGGLSSQTLVMMRVLGELDDPPRLIKHKLRRSNALSCGDWTVQLSKGGSDHRLCRIWFDEDGTYSIGIPYHRANTTTVFRALSMSGVERQAIIEESVREVALDDDQGRIRLSHRPDGTLQIWSPALEGFRSHESDLTIQGSQMGVELDSPPAPSFRCTFHELKGFASHSVEGEELVGFDCDSIAPWLSTDTFLLEGGYFSADWREFLMPEAGSWVLRLVQPNRGVTALRALLSSSDCDTQGFLGIRIRRIDFRSSRGEGFLLKGIGATREQDGISIREEICAIYPAPLLSALPRVGVQPDT